MLPRWTVAACLAAALVLPGCASPGPAPAGPGPLDPGTAPTGPPNRAPAARATATPAEARAGQDVRFDAAMSNDPDGGVRGYRWDFGDGAFAEGADKVRVTHRYPEPGAYTVTLTVLDDAAPPLTGSASLVVAVHLEQSVDGRVAVADPFTGAAPVLVTKEFLVKPGARGLAGTVNATPEADAYGSASARVTARLLDPQGGVVWTATKDLFIVTDRFEVAVGADALARGGFWRFEAAAEGGAATLAGALVVRYADAAPSR